MATFNQKFGYRDSDCCFVCIFAQEEMLSTCDGYIQLCFHFARSRPEEVNGDYICSEFKRDVNK